MNARTFIANKTSTNALQIGKALTAGKAAMRSGIVSPMSPRYTLRHITLLLLSCGIAPAVLASPWGAADELRRGAQSLEAAAQAHPESWHGDLGDAGKNVDGEASLYANGQTKLYAPGVSGVVACREASDPTCRAVQILDRGFPEREPLDPAINVERDRVVHEATWSDPVTSTGVCEALHVTLPSQSREVVCRPGGHETEQTLTYGAIPNGTLTARLIGCVNAKRETQNATCSTARDVTISTPTRYDMICAVPNQTEDIERHLHTDVTLTAKIHYTCTEAPVAIETVTCSQKRVTHTTPACPPGDSVAVTFNNVIEASHRQYRLQAEHFCGKGERVTIGFIGERVSLILPGRSSQWLRLKDINLYARVHYLKLTCEKGTCTASVKGQIRQGNRIIGVTEGKLVFPSDDAKIERYEWVDDCAPFDAKTVAKRNDSSNPTAHPRSASQELDPIKSLKNEEGEA